MSTLRQHRRTQCPNHRRRPRAHGRRDRRVVDLFAGAGGWEEGLKLAGHNGPMLGLETDPRACAAARAAGHPRAQVDVAAVEPRDYGPAWGLVGSPPCQAYSQAGKGGGRVDKPRVIACARELAAGNDTRREHREVCTDPGSLLTVEPLRWTLGLRPRWVALEQVPAVLELWTLFAQLLEPHGYHAAAGVLSAEQHGVPQTRKRAFLIASLDGPVALPAATHRSYDARHPDRVLDGERDREPWVSMAAALGWPDPDGVSHTNAQTSSGRRPRGLFRPVTHPARTLDTSAGAWSIDPPGCRACERPWGLDRRQGHSPVRRSCEPAPTLTATGLAKSQPLWVHHRPATTVLADARVQPPGHKRNRHDPPGRYRSRAGAEAVRVTVEQAALLQGFPSGYPWQGSRAAQFRQIGNAVCPPLAAHVVAAASRGEVSADA